LYLRFLCEFRDIGTHITQTANSTRNNYSLLALVLSKNFVKLYKLINSQIKTCQVEVIYIP